MNYDHVGYLIKKYLWGVNELHSTISRHKLSLIKKNKASQKTPKTEQKQERPRKSILMTASFINYKNNVCLKKATNII